QAYDPMEKAMLDFCDKNGVDRNSLFSGKLIKEYSFTNELKMMGHVWQDKNEVVACIKGSPEKVLELCELSKDKRHEIEKQIFELSKKAFRVIAVGEMIINSKAPESIYECKLNLCGLVALYDPPRETIKDDIKKCIKANIRVVMITGDNGVTAQNIAMQAGIQNCNEIICGDDLNKMTDEELVECVKTTNIFSRVLPEHKMRIVKALQTCGEIVAMTGDGVNDAPALKHADIGIAMGKRGSDVAREAAHMVLLDDNVSTIVNTVEDGRRIYQNIKKAVGYVFTIHIPIALSALIAPLLGIMPSNLMLLPLQIMLLELIIDPTCSIVLERQPPECNIMEQKPRNPKEGLLSKKLMLKSVLQGLTIFAAAFLSYYFMDPDIEGNAESARTMAIVVLMFANLFLVQVNCSEKDSVFKTFKFLLKDKVMWIANLLTISVLLIIVYTPVNSFLNLAPLSFVQFIIALSLAAAGVLWYELVKLFKRLNAKGKAV
ncbi:MAG: cation-translocating P-type ATPase, partial [Firmicutes bacterium]|nr:cation-translocating P-type ATPase [Bacillota bacterium]